jgi:diguanylate cyclase (GGDEF)-like protein/PAS domain S-box-containing protein
MTADFIEPNVTEKRPAEDEARYRALVERIPAVTYVDALDEVSSAIYMSPQVETLLGYPPDEWLVDRELFVKLLHPEDRQRVLAENARTNETGESFEMEYRMLAKDGRTVWVRDEAVLVRDNAGRPRCWQGVMLDVTERKEAEEALRKSEARLSEAQRIARLGNWEWDVVSGEVWWSNEIYRIYGYEPGSFTPTFERLLSIVHPDDRGHLEQAVYRALHEHQEYGFDHRIVLPDGTVRIVHRQAEVVFDEEDRPLRMIGTVQDVTERKALEERLEYQAFHDPLTDLANRTLLTDRLGHALARTGRRSTKVAVLFMDLDNFKYVNDSLGHEVGDRLLVAVAGRVKGCLRSEDTIARFGGDEFIVLLEDITDEDEATAAAESIARTLRPPLAIDGHEIFVTTSIGIAFGGSAADRPEGLLRKADVAMYRAKDKGRDRYEVFRPEMGDSPLRRFGLEGDLRRAVEREEFVVHYEPIVSVRTGETVGVEALVRWKHPERGLLVPAEFVPLAEETGLIATIGRWVLRAACRNAKEWQWRCPRDHHPDTSVNLSARQFRDPQVVGIVRDVLRETGLEPSSLVLEITESVAMSDAALTIAILSQLKNLGVKLAIDDFGTGYSSLSYLKRFPVDVIKIDRSIVAGIGQDSGDSAIVSATIALAHALGLKVVAEGVETAEEVAELRTLGCDFGQGYYWWRPQLAKETAKLLEADLDS